MYTTYVLILLLIFKHIDSDKKYLQGKNIIVKQITSFLLPESDILHKHV